MPGFDGTGPSGMGPMTGGGRGYCALPANDSRVRSYYGRGFGRGRGRGRGRGWRNWYYATGMPGWARAANGMPAFGGGMAPQGYPYAEEIGIQEESEMLKKEAEFLKQQLEDIQSRLSTLEKAQNQEQQ